MMAGKIRLLSDEVIGKIAAGEVVERPAAAIKEMVENSLDAGATAVTVEIRDGGITYFRVTDNGTGIQQSEIRMAFERHATSKISASKDLAALQTLGFRGEALASIAAVAKVTCTSRTREDSSGVKVVNVGGRIESIEEAACPEGTTFVVRDLFYNTPVRLKFLKKPTTEAGFVSDLMMRLILSRPDVSFRYVSQGKTLYHSAGDGKLGSAVFCIYGKEIRAMQEVKGHQAGIILSGYVGTGENGRATRAQQSFFINGRYMKSPVISAALENACRERLPQGRYPSCVLHLTMPFEMVDVNVHPNKLECRFQSDTDVAQAVEDIIRDAYAEKNPLDAAQVVQISPQSITNETPVSIKKEAPAAVIKAAAVPAKASPLPAQLTDAAPVITASTKVTAPTVNAKTVQCDRKAETSPEDVLHPAQQAKKLPQLKPLSPLNRPKPTVLQAPPTAVETFMQSYQQAPSAAEEAPPSPSTPNQEVLQEQSFLPEVEKPLRLIGTAFDSYIIVEYNEHLLLIDQQGVHERLLFDRMMKALDTQSCAQELLIPLIVPATRREQDLLELHRVLLQSIGLTVEPFGENEVAIRSIPMILGQPQAGDLLQEILGQLETERGIISLEKRRSGILALACKKAVRSGEKLNESDIRELVIRMVEKKVVPASPRGTPLMIALTHSDINRRFRRP